MAPYTDLRDLEVAILGCLEDVSKPSNYDFDTWLACHQVLLQIRQTQLLQNQMRLLQNVSDTLSEWRRTGVRVIPGAYP